MGSRSNVFGPMLWTKSQDISASPMLVLAILFSHACGGAIRMDMLVTTLVQMEISITVDVLPFTFEQTFKVPRILFL